jgi:hypothetical protein
MMLSFMEIEIARGIQWQRESHVHLERDQKSSYGKIIWYQKIGVYVSAIGACTEVAMS